MSDGNAPLDKSDNIQLQQELIEELDQLVERLKSLTPDAASAPIPKPPHPDSDRKQFGILSLQKRFPAHDQIQKLKREWLNKDTWKGIWYLLNYLAEKQAEFVRHRVSGDYETDDWDFDPEFLQIVKPFLDFVYKKYWRIQTTGIERLPTNERGILVSNHSGQFAWDGAMLCTAIYNEHPNQRLVHTM